MTCSCAHNVSAVLQVGQGRYAQVWRYGNDKVLKVVPWSCAKAFACMRKEVQAYSHAKRVQGGILPRMHGYGRIGSVCPAHAPVVEAGSRFKVHKLTQAPCVHTVEERCVNYSLILCVPATLYLCGPSGSCSFCARRVLEGVLLCSQLAGWFWTV